MSLASTFWFYLLREGPPTCLRKGRQITQTDNGCLCCWNCVYQIYFTLMNCSKNLFIISSVCCRMKWDFNFALVPYGVRWRKYRRLFHQYFHVNTVYKYLPIQRREVHAFLRRLLVTPDNFLHHIQQ
jgi:hypothetical protein